jgi:leucyl/phenylalanyl-tRNA--protein transferase
VPIEPPPTPWVFPPVDSADDYGLVGVGADLEPGTVLAAYRRGLFPMPIRKRGPIGWWSPDPRAILDVDQLRVTRSLRQAARKYEIRIDTSFDAVIRACGDPSRPKGWIEHRIIDAYTRLCDLGWVHSIEAYDETGHLVGGLYGVAIGGFFAGESMFHHARDASKVALMALVDVLRDGGNRLLDVQWLTPHLESLGAREIDRSAYLKRLENALVQPLPPQWR